MTMITEKKLLGFWLCRVVVKYLFWVQVAPVRFREEPNIFPFLFFHSFFKKQKEKPSNKNKVKNNEFINDEREMEHVRVNVIL